MRRVGLCVAALLLCTACATRHQLPTTEHQLDGHVTTAEQAYQALYLEHQAKRLTSAAMAKVDLLYNTWRTTNRMLIDAVRAGAVELTPESGERNDAR